MGLAARCLFPFLASVSLMACGSDGTAASPNDSVIEPVAVTAAGDDPASSRVRPAPLQFGPIADFTQGVNEINVPRRVFLIVDGSAASAFDRKDPNNGCVLFAIDDRLRADFAISDPGAEFFDQCHGYAYDIAGQPLCSGSRALRPIEIDVVDGIVTWAGMTIDSSDAATLGGAGCPDTIEH